MPRIRPFRAGDQAAVADICLKTADAGADATGVFMTGGNQLKLSNFIIGTPFADAIHAAYARGAAVGGTSAGASIVADHMIAFGSGAQVQLLAPLSSESTIARFLERSGPGLQQLAFRVPDVRIAATRARAAGIRTLYDEPRRGTAGSSINFLHPKDAGGVLVELVQTPAVTAAPEHG